MLGIPADVVDATEHLLGLAHDWRPRRVDVGRVNERHFLFSAGLGLDASVVEKVEAHPGLKARAGEWYYAWTGISTFSRHYLVHPPRLTVTIGDRRVDGVTAIIQNSDPYSYFGDRAVRMAEGATLQSGDLAGVVLLRAGPLDIATITWRALSKRARLVRHRRVRGFSATTTLRIESGDERPLALQVDGEYIGHVLTADFQTRPGGMLVVS
jgi:diacylglycerol kinase family enzyme